MTLARTAQPGDRVAVSVLTRDDYQRPDPLPQGFVMVADPASLPAVNSIVASLPDELEIRLWLGRQHEGDEQLPLASHPRLSATWVPHAELTERVAAELDGVHGWFGWVCVDTAQTGALKDVLRAATGAGKREGHAMGYWTVGRTTG